MLLLHGSYMKKLTAILMIALIVLSLGMPAFADSVTTKEVYYGTPTIDGKLDEMYQQSYYLDIDNYNFGTWSPEEEEEEPTFEGHIEARSYLLWDEYYLYVCTVVDDPAIMTVGQAFLTIPSNWETFENDCVEMWLCEKGNYYKITIDAYGYNCYIGIGNGAPTYKKKDVVYMTTVDEEAGRYIVEAAIPLPEVGPGKDFGYSLQVNDMRTEDSGLCNSSTVSCTYNALSFITVSAATGEEVDVTVITVPETTRKPKETKETTPKVTENDSNDESKPGTTNSSSGQILKPKADSEGIPTWVWIVIPVAVAAIAAVVVLVVTKKKKGE